MNFSPNSTKFLFFKKKYYNFLKNYKYTQAFSKKNFFHEISLKKYPNKIIFISQKKFYIIFVSELFLKLNFDSRRFKPFKKSNMLREEIKSSPKKTLSSLKKIFLFYVLIQKNKETFYSKNENRIELKNTVISTQNLLGLNKITILDSDLKLNINPDCVQIALKTYKYQNFIVSLSHFLNHIKNWSIKIINDYDMGFFRKWRNLYFFFKKKVKLIFQLKYIILNINSKIIKSITTKKYDRYQIKNYNLIYPVVKLNKKIFTHLKITRKLNNVIPVIGYFFEKWEKFEKNTLFIGKNGFLAFLLNFIKNQLSYQQLMLLKSPDLQIFAIVRIVNLNILSTILKNFPFIKKTQVLLPIINLKSFYLFYENFIVKLKKFNHQLFLLLRNLQKIFLLNCDHLVFWLDIRTLFRTFFSRFHKFKKSKFKFLVFHSVSTYLHLFSLFLENSFIKIGLSRTNLCTVKNFNGCEKFLDNMVSGNLINFKCKILKIIKFLYVIKNNYFKMPFFLFLEIKNFILTYNLKEKLSLNFFSKRTLTKLLCYEKKRILNRKNLCSILLNFKILFKIPIISQKFFDYLLIFKKSSIGLYRNFFNRELQFEPIFKRFSIESVIKQRIKDTIFCFPSFSKKIALNFKKLFALKTINIYLPYMVKIKNVFNFFKIDDYKNLIIRLEIQSTKIDSKKVSVRFSFSKFLKISSILNRNLIYGNI